MLLKKLVPKFQKFSVKYIWYCIEYFAVHKISELVSCFKYFSLDKVFGSFHSCDSSITLFFPSDTLFHYFCRTRNPLLGILVLHVLSLEVLREAVYPYYFTHCVIV